MSNILPASDICVDLAVLRQAKADRALAREPIQIKDISAQMKSLPELSILSMFARRKQNEN